MADIYIVVVNDRHSDTSVHPFTDLQVAINQARLMAKAYCRFPEDYKERGIVGWEFYAEYSCEGDSVFVVRCEVDKCPTL